jgi:anti-anti-sigma factor
VLSMVGAPSTPDGKERFRQHPHPVYRVPVASVPLVVWRAESAVVVTLRTDLDRHACEMLGPVLTDLIEGQGNLVVLLDMRATRTVELEALGSLRLASDQARRRGGTFGLTRPSADARRTLDKAGLGDLIKPGTEDIRTSSSE